MIVQCEACQTKFRLADEKVKPGGTKVRCSKCKEVFTVMPPAPEPEPVEETIDFSAMNMEKVEDEAPAEESTVPDQLPSDESTEAPATEPESTPTEEEPQMDMEVDFSALEAEMGENVGMGEELADEFSFADTSAMSASSAEEESDSGEDTFQEEQEPEEQTDFGAAFEETEESGEEPGGMEFDFSEEVTHEESSTAGEEIDFSDDATPDAGEFDFSGGETEEPSGFSFGNDEEESAPQEEAGEFSFEEEGDGAFNFGEGEETSAATETATEEPGEFSFDEENPFGDESSSEWDEGGAGDDTSFDFDEPQFDSESAGGTGVEPSSEEGGLQFGEIDFASGGDEEESAAPSFGEDDFSKATMEQKEEPESFEPERPSPRPAPRNDDDEDILPPPQPIKKKSSLSRVLMLLVLLLLILGGAAGYLFMQEGTLDVNTVVRYMPFLKDYLGEAPASAPVERIGINIKGSSYVNGQSGQMLVIQGAAVNNFPSTRSAITVKGIVLDAQGKSLLQQTVFCGNPLSEAKLETMPFAAIEEAMNNQFGDSLSNMNVAAGATIPFTIVFRNIPDGIANINVEVVESKPGAG